MRAAALRGTVLLGLLGACSPGEAPAPTPEVLGGIPQPTLEHVDPDVVQAVREARAAVAQAPEAAEAWGKLADRYYVHDFTEAAARCYTRAMELDPDKASYGYRKGWSLIDSDPEQAAQAFEQSLKSLDDYAPAHEVYAEVLFRLGREEEALRHFVRASELDPRDPASEAGQGQVWLARGDAEQARVHLEEAVRRDPGHVEAHLALAQAYLVLGQSELARQHSELSRTLPESSPRRDWLASPNLPPAGARARTRHGRQLERQGKPAEAEEQYRAALVSNPLYYAARSSLASLLAQNGRSQEALQLLEEGVRLMPDFEQARLDLERLKSAGRLERHRSEDD